MPMSLPSPNMLVDVVDAHDHPVRTIERQQVFQQQASFRVVHVFIFDSAGKLLLQQLSGRRQRFPLHWGSSVAGYLFAGESYEEAAQRRVDQELNIMVPSLDRLGKTTMDDDGATKFISLFKANCNGPFHPDPGHIQHIQWMALDDVQRAMANGTMAFTPTFLHIFNWYFKP
jgi:16S rRNA (adenine1518-N6/adenine1519-N6)-dimethyltransferase